MDIKKRGKYYSLYKRVPKRFETVETRRFVYVALKTDSLSEAERKAPIVWEAMLDGWDAKLRGDSADAEQSFKAAKDLAFSRGFRYVAVQKLATGPMNDIVERVAAVSDDGQSSDMKEAEAFLGLAPMPELKVSRCLELYWELSRDKIQGKSADQLRRWKNPRIKAVKNFIEVVGDKPIADITPDDMLDFRAWWMNKIEQEELSNTSANKDFVHLGDVLKTTNTMKRLGLSLPLGDLSFKEGEAKQRPPFTDKWIKDKILADGALDGLNDQAAAILKLSINTGARPSELAALTTECNRLVQRPDGLNRRNSSD